MEISPRHKENSIPSLLPSPNSHSTHSSSCSSSPNANNGLTITRSETTNPYPTTFVQADTSSFKQVVQMLTGSSKPENPPPSKTHNIPPIKSIPKKQQSSSGFRLYERRNSIKNLKINPLIPNNSAFSPRKPEILSPSILDFPALVLSPVTPLMPDPFGRSNGYGFYGGDNSNHGSPQLDKAAEAKAIKEKGFYLHPSPATTPRDGEPRLLPLFPTTSPRASGSSSPSS